MYVLPTTFESALSRRAPTDSDGQGFGWLYLIIGVGGIIDAFVHPQSDWIHADRNRVFWVIMMFFFSIFAVVPYLIGVRPLFEDPVAEKTRRSTRRIRTRFFASPTDQLASGPSSGTPKCTE